MTRKKVIGFGLIVLMASLLLGCSDELLGAIRDDVERATAPKEPTIEVSRGATQYVDGSTYGFGSQPTGSGTDITFSIKNTGTGSLLLGTPVVAPANEANGFSVQTLSGTSVASGASVNLVLRFAPAAGSGYSATVTIPSNALNDDSVLFNLTGTGVAPDTTPPTGSISINSNAEYTQSANVTLTLSATDTGGGTVSDMEVNNTLSFTGNWQTYKTSQAWTLAGGDGTNTVYVRFRDNSGNISSNYSDSIILDTVNPTISSRTPASAALNQLRTVNAVVNFSESMNQTTFTTSTVYLRIKGGATVSTTMTKTATSVTLDPVSNLNYGYDYQIVVTTGVRDLSGNSVAASTTDFTVERDYWEGPNGNDLPADAKDLTGLNPRKVLFYWFDFVPTIQQEEWSFPAGVHSKLAQLESTDYYTLNIPEGAYVLELKLFFTSDEDGEIILDAAGPDALKLGVNHAGFGQVPDVDPTSAANYLYYKYTISEPGIYSILVQEKNFIYTNRRKYNLQYWYGDGY